MSTAMKPTLLLAAAFLAASSSLLAQVEGGLGGGGPMDDPVGRPDCLSPSDRAMIAQAVADWQDSGQALPGYAGIAPLQHYPQAGNQYEDLWISNYVDLDGSSGTLDWHCWSYTYDGHDASDSIIRSFGEQLLGVPIFAVDDGVVISTDDGHPDMNTVWAGQPANFVLVDHGGGRTGYYWHMKNGSVAVSPSDPVVAGQQLGLTASSGISNYPHLHFAIYDGAFVTEPYTGACNPGVSSWVDQDPLMTTPFAWDFGFAREDMAPYALPDPLPRTGQYAFTDDFLYHWLMLPSLPPFSDWRVVYKRPDGTTAFDSGTVGFGNAVHYNFSWWWWNYDVTDMNTIAGEWTLELSINGALLVDAPIDVVPTPIGGFNHAPEPITAELLPAGPTINDVLKAAVTSDSIVDDHDYDMVSHDWVWTLDGTVERSVTTGARSDQYPALPFGGYVTVDVTPTDGTDSGATVELTAEIQGPAFTTRGQGLGGLTGTPVIVGVGDLAPSSNVKVILADAAKNSTAFIVVGAAELNLPFKGGVLGPDPNPPGFFVGLQTDNDGFTLVDTTWPAGFPPGVPIWMQWWIQDPTGPNGFTATETLKGITP
jgi:hypothetical protein